VSDACAELLGAIAAKAERRPASVFVDLKSIEVEDLTVVCQMVARFQAPGEVKVPGSVEVEAVQALVRRMVLDHLRQAEKEWRSRTGPPVIQLRSVTVRRLGDGSHETRLNVAVTGASSRAVTRRAKVRVVEHRGDWTNGEEPLRMITTVLEADDIGTVGQITDICPAAMTISENTLWRCEVHVGERTIRTGDVRARLLGTATRPH